MRAPWSRATLVARSGTSNTMRGRLPVMAKVPKASPYACSKLLRNSAWAAIARGSDGVVVGSALVELIRTSLDGEGKATEKTVSAVTDLVSSLAAAVRGVKK